MNGEVDFNEIARKIHGLPKKVKPGDICKIAACVEELRALPFPPGYVDELRIDLIRSLQTGRRSATFVYLAFYGAGDKATYLKIGIAQSVKSRLSGIKTGNPLPLLWAYSAGFPARHDALQVEAALLQSMAGDKVHGEWVDVHGISMNATQVVVESLGDLAAEIFGHPVQFEPARV